MNRLYCFISSIGFFTFESVNLLKSLLYGIQIYTHIPYTCIFVDVQKETNFVGGLVNDRFASNDLLLYKDY